MSIPSVSPSMRVFTFQMKGSNENIYQTRLMEDGNHFYHTCSCPSSHNKKCKHVNQLLSGDVSGIVDFDSISYNNAIEAIRSFKRGMHAINKARIKNGMMPLCRVCKNEMEVVIQKESWLKKFFKSGSDSRKKYVCNNCKE